MSLTASASQNSCHSGSGSNLAFLGGDEERDELALHCRISSSSCGINVSGVVGATAGTAGGSGSTCTG